MGDRDKIERKKMANMIINDRGFVSRGSVQVELIVLEFNMLNFD